MFLKAIVKVFKDIGNSLKFLCVRGIYIQLKYAKCFLNHSAIKYVGSIYDQASHLFWSKLTWCKLRSTAHLICWNISSNVPCSMFHHLAAILLWISLKAVTSYIIALMLQLELRLLWRQFDLITFSQLSCGILESIKYTILKCIINKNKSKILFYKILLLRC